jgi:hypothetical protein
MANQETPSVPRSGYAPAALAGLPGAASVAAVTCGTTCAGACAPSVLGLLGLSGSAALVSWTAWLRPIFLVVMVGSLTIAFFRAYRRPRTGQRFLESRTFVWVMAVVSLGLVALPYGTGAAAGGAAPPCDRPCPASRGSAAAGSPCPPP